MKKIIEIIIYIIIGCFTFVIGYKNYKIIKETNDIVEKTIYIFTAGGLISLLAIYFLDRFNVPSYFNYTENIDTSDWLNFLGTLFSTIVGSLISAVVLILVTKSQIEKTYKDNVFLNKEGYRIQNLPYLKYSFEDKIENVTNFNNIKIITTSNEASDGIEFGLSIKNIGLNAVRKTYITLESDLFSKKEIIELGNQSSIDKNETKKKDFLITNLSKGKYAINITVYYQDLMKNWYEQKINLYLDITDKYIDNHRIYNKLFEVFDEVQIDGEPEIYK